MTHGAVEHSSTTIAALATAPYPSGLAVVRVSGSRTKMVLRSIFRASKDLIADPRRLVFGDLIDFESGEVIDKALAVFMPGPHSFTGEDVGEFQFHGSPLLVQKVLASLYSFGVSPAEAGEFSKRAFLNGKMDLLQAEAIGELINASSEAALRIASEQLKGRFSKVVEEIGEPLRDTLAEIEATIDFPEEEIEPQKIEALLPRLRSSNARLQELLKSYSFGHLVREGYRVLICGRPNVGKSSLLNALLQRPRAIVSDVSGTTRDLIEEQATLGGYRFVFCDSAGLTESTDTVERIGIELARERIPWADVVLLIVDAGDTDGAWRKVLSEVEGKAKKLWLVINKIDLNPKAIGTIVGAGSHFEQTFYLSAHTRDGLNALVDALVASVQVGLPDRAEASTVVTNERHRDALARAHESLLRVLAGQREKLPAEILAAELRSALAALEELVGKTFSDEILGRIFSKFCVGK